MTDDVGGTPPLLPSTQRLLLHRVAQVQAVGRVPTLAAAVIRGGGQAWYAGLGVPAPTDDVQYRIGSITKTFTAVLIMQLRDQGKLELNDPVNKHVRDVDLGPATIRQLLSHQAGLRAEPLGDWWERSPGRSWDSLQSQLTGGPTNHAVLDIGQKFHYSNLGFGILGHLVEQAYGEPWFTTVRRRILDPLQMHRTSYLPEGPYASGFSVHPYADLTVEEPVRDTGAMAPAGQLWSTVADLGIWAAFFANPVEDILHADTIAEMAHPVAVEDLDAWKSGYGLGLELIRCDDKILIGHMGSMPGFLSGLLVEPVSGVGATAVANATYGVDTTGLCSGLIADVLQAEPPIPNPWVPTGHIPHDHAELLGIWYWGHVPYVMRSAGGFLSLTPVNALGRASRFIRKKQDVHQGMDGYFSGEQLQVVRAPDGKVAHLNLATFIFARHPYGHEDVPT